MSFVIVMWYFMPFSVQGQSFSIGLIADCQYRVEPGDGIRKYTLSDKKLSEAVAHFNSLDLEYVIHLGDFIDKDLSSFDVVGPIYDRLRAPRYHVLGNHDFSVDDEKKEEVPDILGMPSRYYDFAVHNWRFVVLDGNDISFHAYPSESERYLDAERYYDEKNISSPKWNGALSKNQMEWLEDVLEKANMHGEQVIIFCHFPIYPDDAHNLWNANEVVELVEDYPCVRAYINGHNHAGNYGIREGIHYLTLRGMVDTEETSYAVMKIRKRRLDVKGFGREQERVLKLKR